MANPEDDPWCHFGVRFAAEALASLKAALDPDNALHWGCRVIKHPDCCVLCALNENCQDLPMHANCFPAGTVVSGPQAVASITRWYTGELVKIKTRSGAVFSCTPNHPVLTAKGWVGAGLLHKGDQVVRESGLHRGVAGDPHDCQQPALIEKVAGSLRESLEVVATRVPVASEDLHGDGVGSKVAIVRTNSLLLLDRQALIEQQRGQSGLQVADMEKVSFAGPSPLQLRFERVALAASRFMRSLSPCLALLGRPRRQHQPVGVASSSVVRKVSNVPSDLVTADTVVLREGLDGLAGAVALDQIVKVRRHPFTGHVFNLETRVGYYMANSIVVHNCRCKPDRFLDTITHFTDQL